jgi:DNA-binding CsgD family transcriptional regulator
MAQTLHWIIRFVPAALTVFYTVDQRLIKLSTGVIVVHGSCATPEIKRALERYGQRYHAVDPFAPRRFAGGMTTVVDLADLADEDAATRSDYVQGYLSMVGMSAQTTMFLRTAGRIVAGIDLMRPARGPGMSIEHLAFLRVSQPLLEHAYACASGLPAAPGVGAPSAVGVLTRREADVAKLVASGASNGDIARALAISEATVKSHLMRAFEKLNVRSRTQLALMMRAESGGQVTLRAVGHAASGSD